MEHFTAEFLNEARAETKPEIPGKLLWKAKFFGKHKIIEYLTNYYEREAGNRVPFYLPYVYMKENFDYLRRYAGVPKHQISMVLIDGNDERIDYFLTEFVGELNFLTIVTDRKEYFESLQERAFQELGLLIELVYPWEEKTLQGNMVWDFTKNLQSTDCYPKGSICFMPHKKQWKILELLRTCDEITTVFVKCVEISEICILPSVAETLLVPPHFPFRKSRCEELKKWCKMRKWNIKLLARTLDKP